MERAQLPQQSIRGLVIEMRKRHPTCTRERRPLNDAVVDQRIVNNYVVTSEQMTDQGDVRRMAANRTTQSSQPWMRASACSSSRWIGRSPETGRLADTVVP